MITKTNLHRHELIGLQAEVMQSKNNADIGIHGKIIDETQKTLVIREDDRHKRVFKENITFQVKLPSGEVMDLDGKEIAKRPWERIKL